MSDAAEWDEAALAETIKEILAGGTALADIGFDADAYDELLASIDAANPKPVVEDEPPSIDQAAVLQEKWKTAHGQVWEIPSLTVPGKSHRLMCGDSTDVADVERLMEGQKADGICTDPPFELDGQAVTGSFGAFAERAIVLASDQLAFKLTRDWYFRLDFIWRHASSRMPWSTRTGNTPLLFHAHCVTITESEKVKSQWKSPASDWPSIIDVNYEYVDGFGQGKPQLLFVKMLEGFPWQTVADPFAGTGVTILACESLKRRCLAMELSAEHVALALERVTRAGFECRMVESAATEKPKQAVPAKAKFVTVKKRRPQATILKRSR